jgi:sodium transport system permease protein
VNFADIFAVFHKEMRSCLRDRNILIYSVLLPLVLYPALIFVFSQMVVYTMGKSERSVSRIAIEGTRQDVQRIETLIRGEKDSRIEESVRNGGLQAAIRVTGKADGDIDAELFYNGSDDLSKIALKRGNQVLDKLREDRLQEKAASLHIPEAEAAGFETKEVNVATPRKMGAFLMGILLPMFLIIMGSIGAFYPAVDVTVGERERNTWEMVLGTATPRINLALGKFLTVIVFSLLAMFLNLGSMLASLSTIFSSLSKEAKLEFELAPAAIPVIIVGGLLIAVFFSASMMIFASFAKTFREGQSMVTPFYLVSFMPAMVTAVRGIEFSVPLACIPIANMALMFRDAMNGRFNLPAMAVTFAVLGLCCVLSIWVSARLIGEEDVILGTHEGNFWKQIKATWAKGRRSQNPGKGGAQ